MATIQKTDYSKIKKMYESGQTMLQISNSLSISMDAVVYAMRKAKIPRRPRSEARRLQFEQKPSSFTIRKITDRKAESIILAGITLYWAEGYKTAKSKGVDFANSDPEMIKLFLRFLRICYMLDENRLRILLYCYSDQNISKLVKFWSKLTGIPEKQFSKPYIRENYSSSGRKMPYGMVHIRYSDKKLIFDILERIVKIKKELCVGGRAVKY